MFTSTTAAKIFVSVEFHGLNGGKIRNACFPTPVNSTKNTHFCRHFFNRKIFLKQTVHNSRKLQVQYLTLVSNDSRSSLRRPHYSLFIRASLANPLFPCWCPIGILGNLSINSKWSPAHPYFIAFFISVELPGPTGKIWCPLASLEVGIFTRVLKSFATQTFGVPFIVKSPLTSGFFQKIASTHHTNLMMLAWGLLKWKMARKKHL